MSGIPLIVVVYPSQYIGCIFNSTYTMLMTPCFLWLWFYPPAVLPSTLTSRAYAKMGLLCCKLQAAFALCYIHSSACLFNAEQLFGPCLCSSYFLLFLLMVGEFIDNTQPQMDLPSGCRITVEVMVTMLGCCD